MAYQHENRATRRAAVSVARRLQRSRPEALTEVPPERWPTGSAGTQVNRERLWQSQEYLVQLFGERPHDGGAVKRMTVCRTTLRHNGDWEADIAWEQLQQLKADIGYADWYGIEIFPRERDLVNVANMRHLWLLERPLPIGWF